MGVHHIMNNLSYTILHSSNTDYNNCATEIQSLIVPDSKCNNNQNLINLIKEATLEIVDNYLYYLPTNAIIPQNIYDFAMYHYVKSILGGAQELADIVYVDTSKDNYLSTKIILDEVDLVVVNLNQNINEFKFFFHNYSSLIKKCVFLISNYNLQSNLSINKISYLFSIPKNRLAAIPYNEDYQNALSRGTLIEFLYSNIDCSYYDPLYPFIEGVRKAVTMILKEVINKNKGE